MRGRYRCRCPPRHRTHGRAGERESPVQGPASRRSTAACTLPCVACSARKLPMGVREPWEGATDAHRQEGVRDGRVARAQAAEGWGRVGGGGVGWGGIGGERRITLEGGRGRREVRKGGARGYLAVSSEKPISRSACNCVAYDTAGFGAGAAPAPGPPGAPGMPGLSSEEKSRPPKPPAPAPVPAPAPAPPKGPPKPPSPRLCRVCIACCICAAACNEWWHRGVASASRRQEDAHTRACGGEREARRGGNPHTTSVIYRTKQIGAY